MIRHLVNILDQDQMNAWIGSISARNAVLITQNPTHGMGIWKYSFAVESNPHDIFYAGPSAQEGNSFLVCRDFAIADVTYRQGIRQFTEDAHRGAGLGRWVLQTATDHYGVLVGDDAGMTANAYALWSNPKNGITAEAIDITTGVRQPNTPALFSTWPAAQVDVLVLTSSATTIAATPQNAGHR
jgi:GNAT superfamily N-acetyltransferase